MTMNDLDSIHFKINRIYEQWDEGEITMTMNDLDIRIKRACRGGVKYETYKCILII